MKIQLATSDRRRRAFLEPDIIMRNRYVEPNPTLSDGDMALTCRPGLRLWQTIGTGPIRGMFSQPGAFNGDLFVMSGAELYRIDETGTPTLVDNGFFGGVLGYPAKMVITGDVGDIPPFLFIADGQSLRVYTDQGFAKGALNSTSLTMADNQTVCIDTTYYTWTSGSVDANYGDGDAPDGTSAHPWRVLYEATTIQCFDELMMAINATGVPGTDYSSGLTLGNPTVTAYQNTANFGLLVHAITPGSGGNSLATTTPTATDLSWGGTTLMGGGTPTCTPVATPGNVAPHDLGYINDYVIIVPAQGAGINGRFWWIEPGYTTIDLLNYATAERSPDAINQVIVYNDEFWLCGQDTTEVWYTTTDPNLPMSPVQGIVIDRGVLGGSVVHIKERMIAVDQEGGVFMITTAAQRISTPDIEERIRTAIAYQNLRTFYLQGS